MVAATDVSEEVPAREQHVITQGRVADGDLTAK
jgi:hypothetical protein